MSSSSDLSKSSFSDQRPLVSVFSLLFLFSLSWSRKFEATHTHQSHTKMIAVVVLARKILFVHHVVLCSCGVFAFVDWIAVRLARL